MKPRGEICRAGLAALGLVLSACSSGDLPDYYKLGGLRVLAVRSNPVEVNPTSAPVSVTLTPFVTDLTGAGRTLTYEMQACLDPGVSLGATPSCDGASSRQTSTGIFTLTGPQYTGVAPDVSVVVPSEVFTGRSETDQYNGVSMIALFKITATNGESTTAFTRVIATKRTELNSVPAITSVSKDGAVISSLPSSASTLTPTLSGSAEDYTVKLSDGSTTVRKEKITLTWFISDGTLQFPRTEDSKGNLWTPPSGSTVPLFLVLVLRDNRGAVDFKVVGP